MEDSIQPIMDIPKWACVYRISFGVGDGLYAAYDGAHGFTLTTDRVAGPEKTFATKLPTLGACFEAARVIEKTKRAKKITNDFKRLLSKRITEVWVSPDGKNLGLVLVNGSEVIHELQVDCCNERWIADVIDPGFLVGSVDRVRYSSLYLIGCIPQFPTDIVFRVVLTTLRGECHLVYRTRGSIEPKDVVDDGPVPGGKIDRTTWQQVTI